MIVKFLSSKNGGGAGSVNYLLNKERVQNGTARVIKGDEQITRDLIATITKKQKTSFAVMSFEEANIPESQKYELIDQFERTFFAGLNKDQYNVLWVEHIDKGRLELNAIIPKIELSTGKAFNPYFNGSDFHIKDLFTKYVNLKYGFSDPSDPAKTASVSGSKKEIGLFTDYENLDKKLKELVAQGAIQDRAELIELLKENGIEVTRTGKDYISVKLPKSKKARRLNEGIYTDKFTSVDELRDISADSTQRERAFACRDRQKEYGAVTQRLSTALTKRAQYNAELYREPPKRKRAAQERVAERARELKIVQAKDNRSSQKQQQETREVRKPIIVESNQKTLELNNDRIRSAAAEYVRSREARSREREARARAREKRVNAYVAINKQTESTDHRAIEQAHGGRQLRNYTEKIARQLSSAFDAIANAITERAKELKNMIYKSKKEAELQKLFDEDKDEQLLQHVAQSRY